MRSRCRRLALAPLGREDMDGLLTAYLPEVSAATRMQLAALAAGSVGRALHLAETGGVAAAELVASLLEALPDLSAAQVYERLEKLGRTDEVFSSFMDMLRAELNAGVRGMARGDGGRSRLFAERPVDALIEAWQAIGRIQYETEELHLDRAQALAMSLNLLVRHT